MTMADLLVELEQRGVRIEAHGDRLRYSPQSAVTDGLLEQLKLHKAELLALRRPAAEVAPIYRADAAAVWQAALDRLEGDPLFSVDLMGVLRSADVRWASPEVPGEATGTPDDQNDLAARPSGDATERSPVSATPRDTPKPMCRCGSTTWRDVPIHGGQSVRRDCARCRRFIEFPVWYGKDTLQNEQ